MTHLNLNFMSRTHFISCDPAVTLNILVLPSSYLPIYSGALTQTQKLWHADAFCWSLFIQTQPPSNEHSHWGGSAFINNETFYLLYLIYLFVSEFLTLIVFQITIWVSILPLSKYHPGRKAYLTNSRRCGCVTFWWVVTRKVFHHTNSKIEIVLRNKGFLKYLDNAVFDTLTGTNTESFTK